MTIAPASLESQWRALAEKAVRGSLDRLRSSTDDGLSIAPLYPRVARDEPRPWRQTEEWFVSPRVDHPDAAKANTGALLDLEGGADALTLVFAGSPFSRGFGLAATGDAIEVALAEVELDLIHIRIDAGPETLAVASALTDLVVARRLTSAGLDIDLGFDPIGSAARCGLVADLGPVRVLVDAARRGGFAGRPLLADSRPYHEAGAGEAQELAAVLATAVAYLRRLEADGLDLATARDAIAVLLATDADLFLGIAKTRAMRRLWARVEDLAALTPSVLRLHAETSWRMMTRFDPWTNVMRATAAVTAAGLGGADAITVLPMTLPLGLPDDGARRLARNVGRVLLDEANLAKVDDPSAGSGGIETLTVDLCERAWALFQDIERGGGIEAVLRAGTLQAQIAATAAHRAAEHATLSRKIVGTSRFPSLAALDLRVLDVPRRTAMRASPGALPSMRDAEPFEQLRDRAEARAASGTRPSLYLATLGAPAAFGARANDVVNVLAAAGIAAAPATEELDIATSAARFKASGTTIACLCGTDKAYAEHAEAAIDALRQAGASFVLMASADETWRGKGADALIHDGENVLQVLTATLENLLHEDPQQRSAARA